MSNYVSFPVPEERLPEVAALLYGASEEKTEDPRSTLTPEEVSGLVRRVYLDSEPTFRRLLLLLADRDDPTEPMLNEEVTDAMGWTTARSLPGALGAYGRRANHRYEGFWPFRRGWDHRHNSNTIAMDAEIAERLRTLHEEHGLPTS